MKHEVIGIYMGMKMTMQKTQEELAELLKSPDFVLISVNAGKPAYRRRKVKK